VRIVTSITFALAVLSAMVVFAADADGKPEEDRWLDTLDAREAYFESAVGPLPNGILRVAGTQETWPGGGLLTIPAPQFGTPMTGTDMAVYTTSGFTNSDMPAHRHKSGFKPGPREKPAAGYGYELMVVAQKDTDWPLSLLEWAVHEELAKDAGFLEKVEKHGSFTLDQIQVGQSRPIDILISKALSPLPTGTQLPAGKMQVLVATAITTEEMRWSKTNGADPLLQKLRVAGVGQASKLGRQSVVR
jgi:hypothetical protein